MAFTVTTSASSVLYGGALQYVYVLTNASESGGASYGAGATLTTFPLTPNASASWIVWAYSNMSSTTLATAAAGNTLDENVAPGSVWAGYVGRYTGTVTGGTQVNCGVSAPSTGYAVAGYEIEASGGTIAKDSSSPAPVTSSAVPTTGTQSLTSASFSPPAASVIVAVFACNNGSSTTDVGSISDTSGLGLTWTLRAQGNAGGNYFAGIWTATVPGSSSTPVSDAGSGSAAESDPSAVGVNDARGWP